MATWRWLVACRDRQPRALRLDCESAAINHTIHDMRIDYVYVSADLAGRVCAARIDDDAQGSDHQPVWVELEL